ncbi:MAG: thiamine phosphate synthase [Candidatus Omnitrophota bacterium]|nr:thiamine phosphate synthase [Candidatus Omnitrophota bacterium]
MNNLYRIVDANFNRTREGLRVLEELARFSGQNPVLTKTLRGLRHRISVLTERSFPRPKLLANRRSETDPGRNFRPEKRTGKNDLVLANSFRVTESLRVLEEMAALLKPEATASFQDLRFSFYDLEKGLSVLYRKKLPDYPVYVIVDPALIPGDPLAFVKPLLDAGAKIFQLRAKKMPDQLFLKLAQKIRLETEKFDACFIVNDRPDIAALSDANGLHLGQTDLPAVKARQICPDVLIGVSVRSVREAEKAIAERVDYVAVGSVFPTAGKEDAAIVGLKTLKEVKKATGRTPLVAIGGITPENSGSVFEAGADYVAVISTLLTTQPEKALKTLVKSRGEVTSPPAG